MAGSPIVVSPSEAWDGNDGPWSTFALGFGSPPQFVRVLVSTTCPQPWAVDPLGCAATDPPNCVSSRGGQFNKNHSSTWQDQGLYELDQELNLGYTGNGDFGLDSISLGYPGSGALILEHQLLATIASKDYYIATWGIAPRPTNLTKSDPKEATFAPEDSHQSLLSTLKQSKEIPSLSYGYTAGARYRLKRVPASLTLGGYDASRFMPSDLTFDLAGDNSRDLVVGVQSISAVGSSQKLLPTPILAFIDATVPHIWLPVEACQMFETFFGINWDASSDLYLVNETTHQALIAQNASLTVMIGTNSITPEVVNITLPYASFDLQVLNTYPNVTNSTRYLIADYERSTFSINQCRFAENVSAEIHPILPLNATNGTKGTNTQSSYHKHDTSNLSAGIIALITVLSVMIFAIIITIVIVLWRRKQNTETLDYSQSDHVQSDQIPELQYENELEPELHASYVGPPELHATSIGPLEMGVEVAAAEISGIKSPRYELHG
ncbi:MAG: hypothetical protein Q9167_007898 [Letrouitia subvulpina]